MSCAEEHIRYLLGENVAGLVARDPEGREVSRPTLTEIGHYVWCIRKRAFRFTGEESDTLKDALVKARDDAVTKERSFTTPLAAQSWAAAAAWCAGNQLQSDKVGVFASLRPRARPMMARK